MQEKLEKNTDSFFRRNNEYFIRFSGRIWKPNGKRNSLWNSPEIVNPCQLSAPPRNPPVLDPDPKCLSRVHPRVCWTVAHITGKVHVD